MATISELMNDVDKLKKENKELKLQLEALQTKYEFALLLIIELVKQS